VQVGFLKYRVAGQPQSESKKQIKNPLGRGRMINSKRVKKSKSILKALTGLKIKQFEKLKAKWTPMSRQNSY